SSRLYAFQFVNLSDLIAAQNERRDSGDRHHWRERFVSDGAIARCDRAKDRDAVWFAFRRANRRKHQRPTGLFFAATRPRSPHSPARTESSCEYLRAALTPCALDHCRHRRRQFAGKIQAARHFAAVAILRPHKFARLPYVLWGRNCRKRFFCRTD